MDREKVLHGIAAFRRLLLRSLIAVAAMSLISFIFSKKIALFLIHHVNIKVYYFSLPEVFMATVELALYMGIFASFPIIVFLLWRETRGLFERQQTTGYFYLLASVLLFYSGAAFCYLVALPNGIAFLISYEGGPLKAMISVKRFIFFCTAMIFAFSVAFQLPLILLLLNTFRLVTGQFLSRFRRYALLFIVIAAAMITPTPDIYNMSLLAVPLYVLYEIGIILVKINERRQPRQEPKEAVEPEP